MKILCLYNNNCALPLFDWLVKQGHECILWNDKLDAQWVEVQGFDLMLSYTYSRIIRKAVMDAVGGNAVNLHTSFLPFNRGVDPNMWSLAEDTLRGVTLHYIDERVDKGWIIYQEIAPVGNIEEATLRTTYNDLDKAAQEVFKKAFAFYRFWPEMAKQAEGKGTYHSDKQGEKLREHITSYDMSVKEFLKIIKGDLANGKG